ncbi:alpha/beta hydrolase [Terrihabitans sp. B22-R8]|uniref:alpha/beta hydrolase n=1 Tax=Terrihabitans sp. B22-R8 TaxID=3425128 RepID=UPI00403CC8DD
MRRTALKPALLAGAMMILPVAALAQTPPPAEPTLKDRVDQTVATVTGSPMANLDIDMKRVVDELAELGPEPIVGDMSADEARKQPSVADAAKSLMRKNGMSDAPETGVTTEDVNYEGAAGPVPARIYKPEGAGGTLPVVLYFHGGGWVIADLDTYDASARALAKQTGAIVVSAHYRQAPENKFPAQHEDAVAAYKWVLANAKNWGGDPAKVALAGESAGGNLAINVALAARDQKLQAPVAQALIYPVAGINVETESYEANEASQPLNKPMMEWFVKQSIKSDADKADPRLDLVGKADVAGLPPTIIVTAEIDPLRTEGMELARKLKEAGVPVTEKDYAGVTHEFFGLGALVADAKDAQAAVAAELKKGFEGGKPAQ